LKAFPFSGDEQFRAASRRLIRGCVWPGCRAVSLGSKPEIRLERHFRSTLKSRHRQAAPCLLDPSSAFSLRLRRHRLRPALCTGFVFRNVGRYS
jgi:hypothetical protein